MPAFPARILVPVLLALSLLAPPARAKEQWVVVSMPHFRVLTTAPAATARKWALELERLLANICNTLFNAASHPVTTATPNKSLTHVS